MKKFLFLTVITALSLASCSENVIIQNTTDQNSIRFDVYAGRAPMTKGAVTDIAMLKADDTGFYMNAVLHSGTAGTEANFMFEQEVLYETDKWTYSPIKYWPVDDNQMLNFYAWGPDNSATATTDPANVLSFALAVDAQGAVDPSAMVDFVASSTIGAIKSGGAVNLNFRHELTRLNFSAKALKDDSPYFVIKSATILAEGDENTDNGNTNEIYTSGTYTFADQTTTAATAATVKGEWDLGDTPVKIAKDIELESIWSQQGQNIAFENSKAYDNATEKYPVVQGTSSSTALLDPAKYMFLLPVGENGTTANTTKIKFEYLIVTGDPKMTAGYSVIEATNYVYLPEGILKQGIAYNICFNFDVTAVTIGEVTVDPWVNATGVEGEENEDGGNIL